MLEAMKTKPRLWVYMDKVASYKVVFSYYMEMINFREAVEGVVEEVTSRV